MIKSKPKLCCFTTVVYGWYQDFIPIYIYSILKSFPRHFVKIFLLDQLTENNRRALQLVKDEISDRFEIIENFSDLNWCKIPHKAALRFLLTREYFEEFEYVYFGDVDFLIYNEYNDNFVEKYLTRCKETGLPFSNWWNYYENKHRITGLHFIIKNEYFDKMDQIIEETKIPRIERTGEWNSSFRTQCAFDKNNVSYDEEMLYYMISMVFDVRRIKSYYRHHCKVHFGLYRKNDPKQISQVMFNYSYTGHLDKINKLCNNEIFKKLHSELGPDAKKIIDKAFSVIFKRKIFL